MQIKEFKSGRFQVWDGNQVLRPEELTWEGEHSAHHNFMFFGSLKKAKRACKAVLEKDEVIKIHEVQ